MNIRASFKFQLFPREGIDSANNYYICIYKNMDSGKKITCKGYGLPRKKGMEYDLEVVEKEVPGRGIQYDFISYKDHVENTKDGVVKYLSSGIIKGIREKTAEKIFQKFGSNTMFVFENEIERLLEVPGITQKKLEIIKSSYEERKEHQELTELLLKYDFTVANIKQVIKHYVKNPMECIRDNPYSLIHVSGIDFYKIEPLAESYKIVKNDYRRIQAAAIQTLTNTMLSGNTCMEIHDFTEQLFRLVNSKILTSTDMQNYVIQLIKDHTIYYRKTKNDTEKEYIFSPSCVQAEHDIAKEILRLLKEDKSTYQNINKDIIDYAHPLVLDESQVQAIKNSLIEPISIIRGGPGTGKSTITRIICDIYEKYHGKESILLASPTGRAARRMEECTGRPAQTIHRMLKLGVSDIEQGGFQVEEVEIENKLVVIDEFSMVDVFVCQKLFKSLKNCHLVIIGDTDQLESVGPGAVLKEIIKSKIISTTTLEFKHRQKKGSLIAENAERMKHGEITIVEGNDFTFHKLVDMIKIENLMIEIVLEKKQEYGQSNVLCLCPFKENYAGTIRMNKVLQNAINPNGEKWSATERDFRIGDPVMHLKNTDEISNGDIGYVTNFVENEEEHFMEVTYFGTYKKLYKVEELMDVVLAYATTVHKSQGSEADCVITCLSDFHLLTLKNKLKRNLPYTAFTRGKTEVVLLGTQRALSYAITNDTERITLLSYEIRKQAGTLQKPQKETMITYEQLKMAL